MTTVMITFDDGSTHSVTLSDEAKEAIRFWFNPHSIPAVNVLKALAGAYISAIKDAQALKPEAGGEFAVAITNAQTASMWAIHAATKEL